MVFAYRYGALGGPTTQLHARLATFSSHFDIHVLFERDLGGVESFPPGSVTVAPTLDAQMQAIATLRPDWFVVFDSGWREPWIRAGSPGRLVLEVRTTSSNLTFLTELMAVQRIDLIIVATRYLAQRLVHEGVGDVAPIVVVPNMLSPSWKQAAPTWTAPVPILLWVGRLEPHKGVNRFIDLSARFDRALLMLVGGTNDTSEEILATVERLHGVPRRVAPLWLTRVPNEKMPRIYATVARSGGMLVVTSDNENFPNTVVEAIMSGCPVVAPAVGGIPELLPSEVLFPPGSPEEARRLVGDLLESEARRRSAVSGAHAIIEPIVRPERVLESYLAALDRALPESPGAAR